MILLERFSSHESSLQSSRVVKRYLFSFQDFRPCSGNHKLSVRLILKQDVRLILKQDVRLILKQDV